MALQRLEALISGVVQGVGFRYFTAKTAGLLGITGWVANMPDGKVRVVGVGEDQRIGEFLKALQRGPVSADVENVDYRITGTDRNEYGSFEIEDD